MHKNKGFVFTLTLTECLHISEVIATNQVWKVLQLDEDVYKDRAAIVYILKTFMDEASLDMP